MKYKTIILTLLSIACLLLNANAAQTMIIAVDSKQQLKVDENDLMRQSQEMLNKLNTNIDPAREIARCEEIIFFMKNNAIERIVAKMSISVAFYNGTSQHYPMYFTFDKNGILIKNDKTLSTTLETSGTTGTGFPGNPDVNVKTGGGRPYGQSKRPLFLQ